MKSGTVFDIKGFALNDGPGIRTTVFMKGCPLRCEWCHNPEGLSPEPEIYIKTARCTGCGKCRVECGHEECKPYGRCLHVCPNGNISIAGKKWESAELAKKLLGDREAFGEDGGVTFSGGEPLMQHEFVAETVSLLKRENIHCAIETSSFASPEVYRETVGLFDFVMADIKLFSREEHKAHCGVPNDVIIENLTWLKGSGIPFVFRVPLIPGITDTDENLTAISSFVGECPVELLTYNEMAGAKYSSVGRTYPLGKLSKQDEEKRKHIISLFRSAAIRK